jgi:hypothetical protein
VPGTIPKVSIVADSGETTGLKWAVDPVADLVTTAGDTLYATAADTLARLAIGTAGQVLQVNSGATAPEWATPAGGGGKVLQVIQGVSTTNFTTTSTSYADSLLSATITPSSASSKVMVFITQPMTRAKAVDAHGKIKLLRAATDVYEHQFILHAENSTYMGVVYAMNFLDTPSTTSATTYKMQLASQVSGVAIQTQSDIGGFVNRSTITLMEIGA